MTPRRVDQIVAGFSEGDAISSEARALRTQLRAFGLASDIFADPRYVAPDSREACLPLDAYEGRAGDVLINHYSIASPALDVFMATPARRVLIYHNITPAEFFRGFDDAVAVQLEQARARLLDVLPATDDVWADSAFNAAELAALGVARPKVFPLLFDAKRFDLTPDPLVAKIFAARMTNILYVGRIAPNKCVEDLIRAFAWYHRTLNRQSRLVIVGSERSCPRYYLMLRMLANELELANVCFERFASPRGLPAYYEAANVFVTASRHEGYCLPLVEAMVKGIPVIAPNRGGMPEAMGGAGVLYEDLTPDRLAVLIDQVVSDPALRREILAGQARRIETLRARDVASELRVLLGLS